MWAICDLAQYLILTKVVTLDIREFPLEARIPSMYFQAQPEDFHNMEYFLPTNIYDYSTNKKLNSNAPASSVTVSLIQFVANQFKYAFDFRTENRMQPPNIL
jgi:sister chromatid cohesion protein PDS5